MKSLDNITNKKIVLISLVILFIIIIGGMAILLTENTEPESQDYVNVIQSADEVEVSLTQGDIPSDVSIKDPNEEIVKTLSEPGDSIVINKFSSNTEYGEYKVLNEESVVIEQFIIEEPDGNNVLNITVVDEFGDTVENANVTVSNTTRETSNEGIAKFYDMRLGYHMFKVESENYEEYNTNFEIISQEMDITVTINKK